MFDLQMLTGLRVRTVVPPTPLEFADGSSPVPSRIASLGREVKDTWDTDAAPRILAAVRNQQGSTGVFQRALFQGGSLARELRPPLFGPESTGAQFFFCALALSANLSDNSMRPTLNDWTSVLQQGQGNDSLW